MKMMFFLLSLPLYAAEYTIDASHSTAVFKIKHMGFSYTHGRFNEIFGTIQWDEKEASKSVFDISIKAESIDTNNKKRDKHLRNPDPKPRRPGKKGCS